MGEGSVTVTLPGDKVAEKTFTIRPKSIYIKPDDCEKERGNPDPEFTWNMTEVKNLNADSLNNLESFLKSTIKLKRQEGEEIVNTKYEIVFADGIAEKMETLFPNYKISLAPEKAYLTITKTHITISAKMCLKSMVHRILSWNM